MSRTIRTGAWLVVLALVGWVPPRSAAGPAASPELAVTAEAVVFPDSAGEPVTRVEIVIPAAGLRASGGEDGGSTVRLEVLVLADPGHDRGETRKWTRDYPVGGDGGGAVRDHTDLHLPPGKAKLHVEVERAGGGPRGETDITVRVPDYRGVPLVLSDLVLGTCDGARAGDALGPVTPLLTRRYGDDTPALCAAARVRDGLAAAAGSGYAVRWAIKDRTGKTRADSSFTLPRMDRTAGLVIRPDTGDLERGTYRLEVEVSLGGADARADRTFEIDETRIPFDRAPRMLRTVLGYVATNSELREIDASPDDSLAAVWTRFWARRDPDPGNADNPAMIEFMRRVDYARRHYGVMEPGWRSDMGRTYIRFGAPDRVERTSNGITGPSTEIWYYDARNTAYVFQDQDGFGRYRLVGSRGN